VVVLFHDHGLERLTDGSGKVWEWRWDDLRGLDAAYHFDREAGYPLRGTGIGIPTLEEAVTTFPDSLFNIDLKQGDCEPDVANAVTRLGIEDRVMIGSFHGRRIERFRGFTEGRVATSAGPLEVANAMLFSVVHRPVSGPAAAFQVPERHGPLRIVTRRFVDAVHAGGKHVHVWTVNEAADMHRLLDLGVDGIVTDRPDVLNAVLEERE
jgi:glycerophosphoryl diester phosphodiesterase